MTLRIIGEISTISLLIFSALVFIIKGDNRPRQEALDALDPDENVIIEETSRYWTFLPTVWENRKDPKPGFIFYGGGFVNERSYAPIMKTLAQHGYPSFLCKPFLDAAIFQRNIPTKVIDDYRDQIHSWVIGGHSLGGVVASMYVDKKRNVIAETLDNNRNSRDNNDNDEEDDPTAVVKGLALLAVSGVTDIANRKDISVVSLWGTKDGLVTRDDWESDEDSLPKTTQFVEIVGGNHAQMGYYGKHLEDFKASITREEQQKIVMEELLRLLRSIQ